MTPAGANPAKGDAARARRARKRIADLLPGLFSEAPPGLVVPTSPALDPQERPRLAGQNAAILARLEAGPATNHELAALSLKYTSRISDLRAAGYDVRVIERDRATGRTVYARAGGAE